MLDSMNQLSVPEVSHYEMTAPLEGFRIITYAVRKPREARWGAFAMLRTEKYVLRSVDVPASYNDPSEAVVDARTQLSAMNAPIAHPAFNPTLTILKGGKA